jgi:hypothetical protein
MLKPDAVGHEEVSGRDLFVVDAGSVDDAIGPLPSTSKYFVCLLAWDATSASEAQVQHSRGISSYPAASIFSVGARSASVFMTSSTRRKPTSAPMVPSQSLLGTLTRRWRTFCGTLFSRHFPMTRMTKSVDPRSALRYRRRTGPPRLDRPSRIPAPSAPGTWMRTLANRPLERAGIVARRDENHVSAGRSAPGRSAHRRTG